MRFAACLAACMFACGAPAPAPATPVHPAAAAPDAAPSAKPDDVALQFARAALTGDKATASALIISYADLVELVVTPPTEADFDARRDELFDQLAREGIEARGEIVAAKIVEQHHLVPGEDSKVRKELDVAVVAFTVRQDGQDHVAPFPGIMIATPHGWRVSPSQ